MSTDVLGKTILITGALGHIGSRLIHSIQPGEFSRVILVDDLSTQRICSLFNLPVGINFEFQQVDVCSKAIVPLIEQADIVVHFAAITNAAASFGNEEEVERVNFVGTQRVADACAKAGSSLMFFSTTSVYGVSEGVVDESCASEQLKPQSPYAESKLKAEKYLSELGTTRNLRFIIMRFGTIFGASIGMRFHTAVNKFIWQACLGQPLTVWRTALDQYRPYLELGDAVETIRFVSRKDMFDKGIYNVLTANLTVRQITDAIREEIPDVRIEFVDTRIMNQLSYTVDRSRIESCGLRFTGDIRTGARETIDLLQSFATSRLHSR